MTPGGGRTSTLRVPATPFTVAVMVAIPGATAVIRPEAETVTTAASLVVHPIDHPLCGGGPFADTLAVRVFVPPVTIQTLIDGEMVTAVTTDVVPPDGVETATVAYPVSPEDVAEIVVDPGATAVTLPVESTVAIEVDAELQVIGQPPAGMVPTVVSDVMSVPCSPGPRYRVPGESRMPVTVGPANTLIGAIAARVPADAVTCASPGAMAVTIPVRLTVATEAGSASQLTGHPPAGIAPTEPIAVENASVSPTIIVAAGGESATEVTHGCGWTVTTAAEDTPPALAEMPATPAARAVAMPTAEIVTIAVSLDCQPMLQPPAGGAPVVCSVAASFTESPTAIVVVDGVTEMPETLPVAVPPPAGGVPPDAGGGAEPDCSAPVIVLPVSPPQETNSAMPATTIAGGTSRRDTCRIGRSRSERVRIEGRDGGRAKRAAQPGMLRF